MTFSVGFIGLISVCCYRIRMMLSIKLLQQQQVLEQTQQQAQRRQVHQTRVPQSASFSRTNDATLLNVSVD